MKEPNPLEDVPSIKTLDEFKAVLQADDKLEEAMQDMEILNANVNREFLKKSNPTELSRAYEIVKTHAFNIKTYKSKYPQSNSPKERQIYNKAEQQMYVQRENLINQFITITG